MAGSIKYFEYTTDAGDSFALKADESNTELGGRGIDFGNASTIIYELPRNVKPRYALYRSPDGNVTRKAYICDVSATPANTTIVDPVSGLTLNLVSINAEEIRIPVGLDTGLIDGDAS